MGTITGLLSDGWPAAVDGIAAHAIAARAVAVLFEEQPPSTLRLLIAVPTGVLFALAARRLRFLDHRGAAAGGLLAASVIGLGGVAWAVPSFVFFMLSSLLSGVGRRRKAALAVQPEKGSQRDAGQVLANGGVGWLLLVFYALCPLPLLYWGFVGAFAAAAADTWATEVGTLAAGTPRHLLTGKPVPHGTSGAVSVLGTAASLSGALAVWGAAWLSAPPELLGRFGWSLSATAVGAAGFLGSLGDSMLGATLQARYREPQSGRLTERAVSQGGVNELAGGLRWMTNDRVNALGTLLGALIAMACFPGCFFGS